MAGAMTQMNGWRMADGRWPKRVEVSTTQTQADQADRHWQTKQTITRLTGIFNIHRVASGWIEICTEYVCTLRIEVDSRMPIPRIRAIKYPEYPDCPGYIHGTVRPLAPRSSLPDYHIRCAPAASVRQCAQWQKPLPRRR